MKVLLINNFHYIKGGSESVYFNMAQMLISKGHQVIFFSCQDSKNYAMGRNDHFAKHPNSVNPLLGAIRYIYNGNAKRALKRLIAQHRPDIAHIHLFWGGLSSSILGVLKGANIPIVHTVHDYRLICPAYLCRRHDGVICQECFNGNFSHCIKHRCAKGSIAKSLLMSIEAYFRNRFIRPVDAIDAFVFVSKFSHSLHLRALPEIAHKPTLIAHNALPESAVVRKFDDVDSYYLYFGRLSAEKGLTTLIKTFTELPHLRLKIVGCGDISEELKRLASTTNIEFCGYCSGSKLSDFISRSRAVIVPSQWYENNPMSIIEAFQLGVPAIGSRIGGIPELVIDGKTGYTFTPQSTTELKQAITRIDSLSQERYEEMCRNCLEFTTHNLSEELLYPQIINLYNSILSHHDS